MKKALLIVWLASPTWLIAAKEKSADVQVSMVQDIEGNDILEGHFFISASTATVWDVLTDYDGMTAFVSNIKLSKAVYNENERPLVEQIMVGKAGMFHKRIHLKLDVEETAPTQISFRDISKKSFQIYEGSWVISQSNPIQVTYHLKANPAFFSPDFLAKKAFKNSVKSLLAEVSAEIERREQ